MLGSLTSIITGGQQIAGILGGLFKKKRSEGPPPQPAMAQDAAAPPQRMHWAQAIAKVAQAAQAAQQQQESGGEQQGEDQGVSALMGFLQKILGEKGLQALMQLAQGSGQANG